MNPREKRPSRLRQLRSLGAEAMRQALEGPLYAAGIGCYAGAARLAGLSNAKAKKMTAGQRDTWRRLDATDFSGKWVWVHCASLGEFEQGRPLIERLKAAHPEYKVLLTFFSPSGYEVRKDYPLADLVCYLPFDTPRNARRFVERVRPEKAIFVKYEFWRNYLRQLSAHSVPTYLVSAVFRPDQAFFRRRSAWYRAWLRWFWHIFVQDERSRRLLEGVGITNVSVAGDTRFDRVAQIREQAKRIPALEAFRGSRDVPVLMAGSSWSADERVYEKWVNTRKDVKVVIAPHEFDPERLKALLAIFPEARLYSEIGDDPEALAKTRILIMDCFGLLSSAYAYADFAYVGGGFGAGLHNINEAAAHGIPVLYGPNNKKFIEAQEMRECGAGMEVASAADFGRVADAMAGDGEKCRQRGRAAKAYIASRTGASDKIMKTLFP